MSHRSPWSIRRAPSRGGFTLVELLVVIAIIGVLVALLLPAVQAAREAARRSDCSNKLKQLAIASHNFHDTYGNFPVGMVDDDTNCLGWTVAILPFMEQQPIFAQIDQMFQTSTINAGAVPQVQPRFLTKPDVAHPNIDSWASAGDTATNPWRMDNNLGAQTIARQFLSAFYCPSNSLGKFDNNGFATSTYVGNVGNEVQPWSGWACGNNPDNRVQNGFFLHDGNNNRTLMTDMAAITDGTSNTIMIGEIGKSYGIQPGALATVNSPNWPLWIGGNNNGGCHARFIGSQLRFVDINFQINFKIPKGVRPNTPDNTTGLDNSQIPTTVNTIGPDGVHFSDLSFGSFHPGGAQFAMGDGSVRFVPETVNLSVYSAMGGRNEGTPVQLP